MSPQLVPFLDLSHQLELMEAGVEINAVGTDPAGWGFRQVEEAAAQRPAALIPLGCRAVGVSPAVGGVVERAVLDVRPVQEIKLGIVGVFVGIEDVDDGKFADRQYQPIFRLRTGKGD